MDLKTEKPEIKFKKKNMPTLEQKLKSHTNIVRYSIHYRTLFYYLKKFLIYFYLQKKKEILLRKKNLSS